MLNSTTRMVFGILAIMAPLLPVYIIYRLMGPIVARIQGTISRWTIHIGGPAALYFILVMQLWSLIPAIPTFYEPWKITGYLLLEDQREPITENDIATVPSSLVVDPRTGSFSLDLVAKPNNVGIIELPDLVLSHPRYEVVNLSLSGKQDEHKKKVSVTVYPEKKSATIEPVTLKKIGH